MTMTSWTTCRWCLALCVIAAAGFWLGRSSTATSSHAVPAAAAPVAGPTLPAGGDWQPFALLLVDVQNDFFTPDLQAAQPDYSENVTELLGFCREHGIEVVHLRIEFSSFDDAPASYKVIFQDRLPCLRGSEGALPAPFARALPEEQVFYKTTFDGFSDDALPAHLRAGGKRHLLIAGLTTDLCVLATTLGALDKGYTVSIVEDCCLAYSAPAHDFIVQHFGGFLFDTVPHDGIQQSRRKWLEQMDVIDREVPRELP